MAGSLNKVQLIGNLGKDPEIRRTQDGRPIANFSIATSESWRDKNSGERKEKTFWHNVVCFSEGLCKIIEQYVSKGSKVYVSGSLETRKWTDKDGNDRWSTEVVMKAFNGELILLSPQKSSGGSTSDDPRGDDDFNPTPRQGVSGGMARVKNDMDDEIPFGAEFR